MGRYVVVGIDEEQKLALGLCNTSVARSRNTLIFSRDEDNSRVNKVLYYIG